MNQWIPIQQVQLENGRSYCVGRGADAYPDVGTWREGSWSCSGDEFPEVREMPVLFVLNGEPLPLMALMENKS
jgi:hypothetical protein